MRLGLKSDIQKTVRFVHDEIKLFYKGEKFFVTNDNVICRKFDIDYYTLRTNARRILGSDLYKYWRNIPRVREESREQAESIARSLKNVITQFKESKNFEINLSDLKANGLDPKNKLVQKVIALVLKEDEEKYWKQIIEHKKVIKELKARKDLRGNARMILGEYARGLIAKYAAAKIKTRPSIPKIIKRLKLDITTSRAVQILQKELSPREQEQWKKIPLKKNVSKEIFEANHLMEQEVNLFWKGEIDRLSEKNEIANRFKIKKAQVPLDSKQRKTMIQLQRRGSLKKVREILNFIKQEMAEYQKDDTKKLSTGVQLSGIFKENGNYISRYIRSFLPADFIIERQGTLLIQGSIKSFHIAKNRKDTFVNRFYGLIEEYLNAYQANSAYTLPGNKEISSILGCSPGSVDMYFGAGRPNENESERSIRLKYRQIRDEQKRQSRNSHKQKTAIV